MKINHVFLITFVFCLLSCTTSRTVVSDSADLEKYQYASLVDVMDYKGSAALMDMEVHIYDAVESTRLKMMEIEELVNFLQNKKNNYYWFVFLHHRLMKNRL